MLGIMVALIKIAEVASVETGIGMYAVFALIVLIPSILVTFDARELWSRVEWVGGSQRRRATARRPAAEAPSDERRAPVTAASVGLVSCEACQLLSRPASRHEPGYCRRCGEKLEFRHHAVDREHVGARHRRGDLLHPGERCCPCSRRPRWGRRSPTRS